MEYTWLEDNKTRINAHENEEVLTWPAFHSWRIKSLDGATHLDSHQEGTAIRDTSSHQKTQPKTISVMLPLIDAPSNSPSTMKHAIDQVIQITNHLNPGQKAVMALDQPLYTQAKELQHTWPDQYGKEMIFFIMGGLHIEMEIMRVLGHLLNGSGWIHILNKAQVCGPGNHESFLNAACVKKTRHAHQVTAAALYMLQQESYEQFCDATENPPSIKEWRVQRNTSSTHFFFWDLILNLQIRMLSLLRATSETNLQHYIEMLKMFIPLLFALDKRNYAKWLTVHVDDMLLLKQQEPDFFEELPDHFTVRKSQRLFSSIATDQAHEMNNATVKGTLKAISMMDSPDTLLRWMLSSPILMSLCQDFEQDSFGKVSNDDFSHLDDSVAKNTHFCKDVISCIEAFKTISNPFDELESLYDLESGIFASEKTEQDLRSMEDIGAKQHAEFVSTKLRSQTSKLSESFTMNKLEMLSSKEGKRKHQSSRF